MYSNVLPGMVNITQLEATLITTLKNHIPVPKINPLITGFSEGKAGMRY